MSANFSFLSALIPYLDHQSLGIIKRNRELELENEELRAIVADSHGVAITGAGGYLVYATGSLLEASVSHDAFFNVSAGMGNRGAVTRIPLRRGAAAEGTTTPTETAADPPRCSLSDFWGAEVRIGTRLVGLVSRHTQLICESMFGDENYRVSVLWQSPHEDDETSATPVMQLGVRFGPIPEELRSGDLGPQDVMIQLNDQQIPGGVIFKDVTLFDTANVEHEDEDGTIEGAGESVQTAMTSSLMGNDQVE